MVHSYARIREKVTAWRQVGCPAAGHPALAEILAYARLPETGAHRFSRAAQLWQEARGAVNVRHNRQAMLDLPGR